MSAVSAGREAVAGALLAAGADVNAKNSSGQTALHYAVRSLHHRSLNPFRKYEPFRRRRKSVCCEALCVVLFLLGCIHRVFNGGVFGKVLCESRRAKLGQQP